MTADDQNAADAVHDRQHRRLLALFLSTGGKMGRTAKRIAIVTTSAAAALVMASSPAMAATSEAKIYTSGTIAGKAWFNSGPNYWDIKDEKCDGKSVILHYAIGGGWFSTRNGNGCGTTVRHYLTQGRSGNQVTYYLALSTSTATGSRVTDVKG